VLGTLWSTTISRPDLRNRRILVGDVVVEMVAGGTDKLNGVLTHIRYQFHGSTRDGMAREIEMVHSAGAIPVAPVIPQGSHMLLAEALHSLGAHSLIHPRSRDRHRHEEEVGLGGIGCHVGAFHQRLLEVGLACVIPTGTSLPRAVDVAVWIVAWVRVHEDLDVPVHLVIVRLEYAT